MHYGALLRRWNRSHLLHLLRTGPNHSAGEEKDQEPDHRKTPLVTRPGDRIKSNLNEQEPPLNQNASCLKNCDDGHIALDTLDKILSDFSGLVKLRIKHNPLAFHPRSKEAARALIAAELQGKFLPIHQKIINYWKYKGRRLEGIDYLELARQAGLNISRFKRDWKGGASQEILLRDMTEAKNQT